jgi:hypothetical protein
MRLTLAAAALAAAMSTAVPSHAGGEWPDGPNKLWFEKLQRPDNHLAPYRNIDPKSLSCCGIADTVKTKFKVEPGDERYPEDRWYAWLKDQWVRVPRKRSFPTSRRTGKPICFCSPIRSNASCRLKVAYERPAWRSPQLAPLSRSCCLQTPL